MKITLIYLVLVTIGSTCLVSSLGGWGSSSSKAKVEPQLLIAKAEISAEIDPAISKLLTYHEARNTKN